MLRRFALVLVTLSMMAFVPSCAATRRLPPCSSLSLRMWCQCEVAQTTRERAVEGLPVACTIPFVVTKCVEKTFGGPLGASPGGVAEFLAAVETKIDPAYAGPGGYPPYVMVGDRAFWIRCPVADESGTALQCVKSGQLGNPWPSYPVVDLDQADPLAMSPGLKPQSGGGGAGAGGGPAEGGDCALCLANAPCDGLTQQECVTMHCAAVCPWDDTATTCQEVGGGGLVSSDCGPPGASCGNATDLGCCAGAYCMPSDVGAFCM